MKNNSILKKVGKGIETFFSLILIGFIRLYQITLSPLMGRQCRFTPTCSQYGIEAIKIHGPWRGFFMTIHRILRCNPWGGSGYDPVPEKKKKDVQ